jgi:hypothetical protein
MIRIPNTDRRYSQPNNSDAFGNIHYTKNVSFDEEGYIKLSPRAVALASSEVDADINIPTAFGREESEVFFAATTEKPLEIDLSDNGANGVSAAADNGTGVPNTNFDSHARWWQNRWYVVGEQGGTDDELYYRDPSSGNWTDTALSGSITFGKAHPLEVFRNRATLCIGNGNEVLQINTSHSATTNLTIPADYEVIGLAYNDKRMGIITKLADSAAIGQNQDAFFFVWDGATSSANEGYAIGSDMAVAIAPYKSSFVILTRTGNLLYWTGGGLEQLTSLPLYYFDRTWGDSRNREALGDVMAVDGDIFYMHLNNSYEAFGERGERFIPSSPGGVLCYDPKVGLYHRYSPSISLVSRLTVTTGNTNTSTDIMTKTAGTIPATGNPIKYVHSASDKIGGLKTGRVYYCIKHSSTTFSLATTKENALNGVKVDLTAQASGTSYFLALDLLDYGASYMDRTGGIGMAEGQKHVLDRLIFGGEYFDSDSANAPAFINFTTQGFKNIGYFVVAKDFSNQVTDTEQKLIVKYRPLAEGDTITAKVKTRDYLNLPVSTPQVSTTCTWTSPSEFYTTADLSAAKTAKDAGADLECEIISGAAAGQMAQITSITEDDGTYSVVLAEELEGAASGRVCNVLIENWTKLGTITSSDTDGYREFPIGTTAKWAKAKVILSGVNVTIEEIQLVNEPHKLSA